ncbi:conserved hypothetical protein [gamma proteobacterium HdN1]|nr:conserved hypothetical protein [gamma proteobacterium HdN1]
MGAVFNFFRAGGFNQVRFDKGSDLLALAELDQKLWVALACPVNGLVFDKRTLQLIDTDHDGRIRAGELISAVQWAGRMLNDADDLMRAPMPLPLSAINTSHEEGKQVLRAAKTLLRGLGKPDAAEIGVEDTSDAVRAFNALPHNGDGVITVASVDTPELKALLEEMIATVGGVNDLSGEIGINEEKSAAFFEAANAWLQWYAKAQETPDLLPLGEESAKAHTALLGVRGKIDDYFLRCRLAAFDTRAVAALNREEKEYYALAAKDLVITNDEILGFPVAHVDADRPLPLRRGINPAWTAAMNRFVQDTVTPLLGEIESLTESAWVELCGRFAAFEAWQQEKAGAVVEALGAERLRAAIQPALVEQLNRAFASEKEEESTAEAIASVERLVYYVRDIYKLATNFVSFQQFYQRKAPAIFQVGTLYIDQRACELCVRVDDVGKHATMAPLSSAYLAYCECTRPASGEKMTIVAAVTNGSADNLMVGRNGIFYDRDGKDWDATIVRLVENPTSLHEAFWSPYKKLVRFVEGMIAKRAEASDAASTNLLSGAATGVADAAATGKSAVPPKKFDVGTIAAMGVAVGGITAALGALLQAFFGLGLWMPLGLVGLVLVISVPSMVLAWLKLRQRNIGPLLDASGWAVNANARINVPFGSSLTRLAALPKGSRLDSFDPFAEKKRPWKFYGVLAAIVVLAVCWGSGRLDSWLPKPVRSDAVFAHISAASDSVAASANNAVDSAKAGVEKAAAPSPAPAAAP